MDRLVARAGRLLQQAQPSMGARAPRRLHRILAVAALAVAALAAGTSSASASVSTVQRADHDERRRPCCARTSTCRQYLGPYPTVLTVTGYNKDAGDPTGQNCELDLGGHRRRRTGVRPKRASR